MPLYSLEDFTDAERAALLWLPRDEAWREATDLDTRLALLAMPELCESRVEYEDGIGRIFLRTTRLGMMVRYSLDGEEWWPDEPGAEDPLENRSPDARHA